FGHAVGKNCFHLVWKPKYAKDPMRIPGIRRDVEFFLREVCERYHFEIYESSIQPDHVHLFCDLPPTMSIAKALQLLKGYSAYAIMHKHPWLRKYFRKGHFWSPGKFFRSVGNVTAETIQHYISQSQGSWNNLQQRKVTSFA
ncbi:MAG TPA: IS200/IS605 family transposase, partial [Candidatus Nanoarchaeia archaeon]|nr:IS200/IS605 family transposase [Candidatus Nanoarchaeia archaeon]